MKKLTAGIFATLLAVVSTGAANAKIASQGYVDQQIDTVEATVTTKADKSALDTLSGTVAGHTEQIGTINTTLESKVDDADIADMLTKTEASTTYYTQTDGTALEDRVDAVEAPKATVATGQTGPVSGQTVYNAIQGVTGNVDGVQDRVESLETTVEGLQTSKQDADTAVEVGTAGTAVGSTTQPVYVNESGVVTPTNALGSLAWESTVGTAEIEDNAVTTAKIGDGQVTAAKIASGVVPTVTTSIVTGNTGAAQAGAVADALAGKVDDAELSAYSTTQQMNTAISSATADMQTTTNLVKTIRDSATATDTQYPSEKAVATAIDTITTDAIEGLNLGALATMDTVGSDQIDNGAVTQAKIGANAVGTTQIADGAVTTGKIADGTITNADISNTAEIAMAKIAGLEEALAGVIEKPEGCQGAGSDCVLVIKDGTIQWEDVARGDAE